MLSSSDQPTNDTATSASNFGIDTYSVVDNCAVCHEAVIPLKAIPLHGPFGHFKHYMHLDCFQTYINSYHNCPICLGSVEEKILSSYATPCSTVVSWLNNDGFGIDKEMIYKMLQSSDARSMLQLLQGFNVTNEGCKQDKISAILSYLLFAIDDLNFMQIKSELLKTVVKFSASISASESNVSDKFEDVLRCVRILITAIDPALAISTAERETVCGMICPMVPNAKFVTSEMWSQACLTRSSRVLGSLFPHILPSCFQDGILGTDIALRGNCLELLDLMKEIDASSVTSAIQKVLEDPQYCCTRSDTAAWLIENGCDPNLLFTCQLIVDDNRETIATLLRNKAWPVKFFQVLPGTAGLPSNTPQAMLLEKLKSLSSIEKISAVVELGLVVLGYLHYPAETDWLLSKYVARELSPSKFNERIDLCSNPHLSAHSSSLLKMIIQDSWKSWDAIETELLRNSDAFVRLYQFDVLKSIPLVSRESMACPKGSCESVITILGMLNIPIYEDKAKAITRFVKERDSEGLKIYLTRNHVSLSAMRRAIDLAAFEGCPEMMAILTSQFYKRPKYVENKPKEAETA